MLVNEQVTELRSVKHLLVLLLMKLGSTSDEIGTALGIDPSAARKMVPARKVSRLDFRGGGRD